MSIMKLGCANHWNHADINAIFRLAHNKEADGFLSLGALARESDRVVYLRCAGPTETFQRAAALAG